jgi:hypothetical protein
MNKEGSTLVLCFVVQPIQKDWLLTKGLLLDKSEGINLFNKLAKFCNKSKFFITILFVFGSLESFLSVCLCVLCLGFYMFNG